MRKQLEHKFEVRNGTVDRTVHMCAAFKMKPRARARQLYHGFRVEVNIHLHFRLTVCTKPLHILHRTYIVSDTAS